MQQRQNVTEKNVPEERTGEGEGRLGEVGERRGVMEDTRVTAPLPDPAILTSPTL